MFSSGDCIGSRTDNHNGNCIIVSKHLDSEEARTIFTSCGCSPRYALPRHDNVRNDAIRLVLLELESPEVFRLEGSLLDGMGRDRLYKFFDGRSPLGTRPHRPLLLEG